MNTRTAVVLTTAAAPAAWGSTYVVTTELLPPDRPLLAGAARALPAGLLLLAVTRRLPAGDQWWRWTVLGTLNIGVFFALLFVSAYRLPGGVAAVMGAAQPLLVAGLTLAVLHERVARRSVLAGLAGLAGVAVIVLSSEARLDGVGLAAGAAGTCSMALGLVLTKHWGRPRHLLASTGWQLTAGGLLLLPLALAVEGTPATLTLGHVGGYAYLSLVGTAVAYVLWFRGIALLPAVSTSLLALLSPVVAALLGWTLLDQHLSPLQLLGTAVALAAVAAGQSARPAPTPPSRRRAVRRPTAGAPAPACTP